jgi:hypothetical protein
LRRLPRFGRNLSTMVVALSRSTSYPIQDQRWSKFKQKSEAQMNLQLQYI